MKRRAILLGLGALMPALAAAGWVGVGKHAPGAGPSTVADHLRLALVIVLVELGAAAAVGLPLIVLGRDRPARGVAPDVTPASFPAAGDDPPPPPPAALLRDPVVARMMPGVSAIEFAPPAGVEPWQGAVLATESMDAWVPAAWFAHRAAVGVFDLRIDGSTATLGPGPAYGDANAEERSVLRSMLGERSEARLDVRDAAVARAVEEVSVRQRQFIQGSGWWRRLPNDYRDNSWTWQVTTATSFAAFVLLVWSIGPLASAKASPTCAVLAGALVVPGWTLPLFIRDLPSRSALGGALAQRTEVFRRYLGAADAPHVDWAARHGLLREYTVWAVALGEAAGWQGALGRSSVGADERAGLQPLLDITTTRLYSLTTAERLLAQRTARDLLWRRRRYGF